MIRLVTYSDANMSISKTKCIYSASTKGVTDFHDWDRHMLEATEFYQLNREILDQQRGSGYWLWKPYIIYKALLDMNENDYLVYSDAGVEFINNVSHIIDKIDEDVFLFGNNWNHVDWCKGDVMAAILGDKNDNHWLHYWEAFDLNKQVQASVIFMRPTQKVKEFIKEWLCYCMMPNLIDDSPSKVQSYPTFQDHRHDQAILTCLQIKHGLRLHWWPASYSNGAFIYDKIEQYKGDNYPVIFHHTRKRNWEW